MYGLQFYIADKQAYTQEFIATIVNTKKLPQEIRDSWIEYATILNIDKLHE